MVAGILAREDDNLDCWKQIKESIGSHIATEGCMDILELSYKHLPLSLKPCFLYFGAFPETKILRVRKLMKLWIAEVFIPRNEVKSLYDMARDSLMELIDRSLVLIAARNSKGEIKACRVRDLLHDFCLAKAREENLLQWIHGYDVSSHSSDPRNFDKYRLFIDGEWDQFIDSRPAGPGIYSLLVFGIHVEWCPCSKVLSFLLKI